MLNHIIHFILASVMAALLPVITFGQTQIRDSVDSRNLQPFDGATGDTSTSESRMPPIVISKDVSPVHIIEVKAKDGGVNSLAYRMPPGEGPFPAVILFHGSTAHYTGEKLANYTLNAPVHTRFLKKGYAIVAATRRRIHMDQERTFHVGNGTVSHTGKSLLDCIAAVEAVRKIPKIDTGSMVIYGGSAGAALAIETASQVKLAAVAAGEPASHLFIGGERGKKELSTEQRAHLEATLMRIDCPVLILHGDKMSMLVDINKGPVMKAFRQLEKSAELKMFPGRAHGFYWGHGKGNPDMTITDLEAVIDVADRFFKRHLKTAPQPTAL